MAELYEKVPGLVSLLKLQNVIVLLTAQLLMAHFLYDRGPLWDLLIRHKFVFLLLATGSAISGGYIINHFYHLKRDWINRPLQTDREQKLSVSKQLYLYFFLNFLTLLFAAFISWRAVLFFAVYVFLIWLYFHKLHSRVYWRETFLTFLTVYPFFGVMLFFRRWNVFVVLIGLLFALLIMLKELIKNHLTLRGDVAQNIRTVLAVKGEAFQQKMFVLISAGVGLLTFLLFRMDLSVKFRIFLGFFVLLMIAEIFLYLHAKYREAYGLIKMIIISGLFALFLL